MNNKRSTMGQKYQTSPSRKCTSFINNARSFFIKLVHFQHASPKKADDDPQPVEDAATETLANQQPPAYEVAMQTPSHLPENALRDARHDTSPQERRPCSTAASDSMILERLCPPPRSYTRSPLPSMRPSSVLPTRRSREDAELLDDRRSPRPSFSRPSCSISIDNPRPGNKRFMAHKLIKASSASSLNSPRHLGTNAHSSTITRRDRELLAAKKSLPILTYVHHLPSHSFTTVSMTPCSPTRELTAFQSFWTTLPSPLPALPTDLSSKYDKPSRSNKNSPLL